MLLFCLSFIKDNGFCDAIVDRLAIGMNEKL